MNIFNWCAILYLFLSLINIAVFLMTELSWASWCSIGTAIFCACGGILMWYSGKKFN